MNQIRLYSVLYRGDICFCTAMPAGVSRSDENYQSAKRNFAVRYPGGESYFDVAARVYPFLKELKELHPDDTVLIVTHAGTCRVICSFFEELNNKSLTTYTIPNCGYRIYEY